MEERISGFRICGKWGDAVTLGNQITQALKNIGANNEYEKEFKEWNEWRPKLDERLSNEINEKTAEKASVNKGVAEKDGKDISDNLDEANNKLQNTVTDIKQDNRDTKNATKNLKKAIGETLYAADTTSRMLFRLFETSIYQRVMTVMAPYYFDNQLISANIKKTKNEEYMFEVNVSDDEMKNEVRNELKKYESNNKPVERDYQPDAVTVRDAEGIEKF